MVGTDGGLVGRYFVEYDSDIENRHGWVVRDLGSGLFLLECFLNVADQDESILQIEHVVAMRNCLFYKDPEAAERHHAAIVAYSLPEINLHEIARSSVAEFGDMVIDQIIEEWARGHLNRVQELEELLKSLEDIGK